MDLLGSGLLPLIVFSPLVGVVVLAFLPKEESSQHRTVALLTSLGTFVLSLVMLAKFEVGVAGFQESMAVDVVWIESLGVRFHMAVDGISLFLVLLTTFLTPIVILSTFSAVNERTKEFMFALLALEVGMLGAFVAVDLILFYVFWEGMLIPMYLLIGVWGGDRRIYSALKFFLYTMVGSLLMLLAIIYLYFQENTFDFRALLSADLSLTEQRWLFWAFVAAFVVKIPMVPFHTWLPDAHVEAPTAGSVILAGVLLKMGSYGLMRFAFPLFPDAATIYAPVLGVLAVVCIVYGALMAMAQRDVKKLIAYSSVSHMGFVVLGLCALTTKAASGAVFQMLSHGVSSGALFLLVGILYERRHTRLLSDFGGIAKVMPFYATFFLLVVLSSAGLPGTNGFVGEFLILMGSFTAAPIWTRWATGVAATGVILGAVYLLWMYRRIFFGPLLHSANKKLTDLTVREWFVLTPLAVLVIVMGVYPQPFLERITPSAEAYVGRVLSASPDHHQGVVRASPQIAKALVGDPDAIVLLGPGRAIDGSSREVASLRSRARAWDRVRSTPVGLVPTPVRVVPQVTPTLRPRILRPGTLPRQRTLKLPSVGNASKQIMEKIRRYQRPKDGAASPRLDPKEGGK